MFYNLKYLLIEGSSNLGRLQRLEKRFRRKLRKAKERGDTMAKIKNVKALRDIKLRLQERLPKDMKRYPLFSGEDKPSPKRTIKIRPTKVRPRVSLDVEEIPRMPKGGIGRRDLVYNIKHGDRDIGSGSADLHGKHLQTRFASIQPSHQGKGIYTGILKSLKRTYKPKTFRPDTSLTPAARKAWYKATKKTYDEFGNLIKESKLKTYNRLSNLLIEAVPHHIKSFRRKQALVGNPESRFHMTSLGGLRGILKSGIINPTLTHKSLHGLNAVYFGKKYPDTAYGHEGIASTKPGFDRASPFPKSGKDHYLAPDPEVDLTPGGTKLDKSNTAFNIDPKDTETIKLARQRGMRVVYKDPQNIRKIYNYRSGQNTIEDPHYTKMPIYPTLGHKVGGPESVEKLIGKLAMRRHRSERKKLRKQRRLGNI
jgi:hypothetical protein